MKKTFNDITNVFKNMNKISKKVLIFGSAPLLIIALACLVLYIFAGRLFDYYWATQLLSELLLLEKELLGVIAVPALLIEVVDMATGKKSAEKEAEEKNK